jgi:hypothetical protein
MMAHSEPFDQLTGTLTVYIAPVGSTVPDVANTPESPWVEIGCTDGEQSLQHAGALEYFRDNCHQGPVKAVRPEEDVIVAFTLVGLTLENYAYILHAAENVATDTDADPDTKTMPLKRGFVPTEYAMLFRGEALSPYGVYAGMYVIPRGVFDGEPQPTFAKDGRAGLEVEFHALEDDDQEDSDDALGWLVVALAVCTPPTSVVISGSEFPTVDEPETYTATVLPESVSDLTIVWTPAPTSGQGTLSAVYTFTESTDYTIGVTVQACGIMVYDTHDVTAGPGS